MSTGFVYLRPLNVVFARATGPYANSSHEAWGRMFDWLDRHALRRDVSQGFGLLLDNPAQVPSGRCRYDACVELMLGCEGLVPEDFSVQRLPGGAYVRTRHTGSYKGLRDAFARLRDEWAPEHGTALDPRRPLIEIYLDDPARVPEAKRRVDICIPVSVQTLSEDDRSAA